MNLVGKFCLAGFRVDLKEAFILLLRHLGSAGIGRRAQELHSCHFTVWSAIMLSVNDLLLSSHRFVKVLQTKELFPALERDKY